MNDNISDKDKKDWHKFINSTEKLPNKDYKHQKNKNLKVRSIDLHGYTLDEANKTIEDFINKAYVDNVYKLIVVTGKGLHSENEKDPYVSKDLGILKYSRLLAKANEFGGINIEGSPFIVTKLSSVKFLGSAVAPFILVKILNSSPHLKSKPKEKKGGGMFGAKKVKKKYDGEEGGKVDWFLKDALDTVYDPHGTGKVLKPATILARSSAGNVRVRDVVRVYSSEGEEGISELAWTSPFTRYIIEAFDEC